jgi:hypothetical protein
MNKQLTPPQFFFRLLCACGISLLITLSPSAVIAAPNSDACALLKPSDLTTLLGGTPIAKPNMGNCSWSTSGSKRKLMAIKYKAAGPGAEMAFAGMRNNVAKDGKVTDEAGIGDKAFAATASFGVALMMLKHGRLLQLQYMTGAAGTAKDLGMLRPVAKKAVAAF